MTRKGSLEPATLDVLGAQGGSAALTFATAVVTMRVLGARHPTGFRDRLPVRDRHRASVRTRKGDVHREIRGRAQGVALHPREGRRDALGPKVGLSIIVGAAIAVLAGPIAHVLGADGGRRPLRPMAAAVGRVLMPLGHGPHLKGTDRVAASHGSCPA